MSVRNAEYVPWSQQWLTKGLSLLDYYNNTAQCQVQSLKDWLLNAAFYPRTPTPRIEEETAVNALREIKERSWMVGSRWRGPDTGNALRWGLAWEWAGHHALYPPSDGIGLCRVRGPWQGWVEPEGATRLSFVCPTCRRLATQRPSCLAFCTRVSAQFKWP